MLRLGSRLFVGVMLLITSVLALRADPPVDEHTRKLSALAVQQGMAAARQHLRDSQPKRAVELLEDQLPRVNGNPGFLELLSDAYRDYIMKLSLDHETSLAQRYLQRLRILAPQTAADLTIAPEKAVKFEARPAPKVPALPLPNFAANHPAAQAAPSRVPAVVATMTGAKPSTVRGKMEEPNDDPFDLSHQQTPANLDAAQLASQLLARANDEFTRRRYKEARLYFEQAWQADQRAVNPCRDNWAYCVLNDVVDSLNRPNLAGKSLPGLKKDVYTALTLCQAAKLSTEGQKLLREIDLRAKAQTSAIAPSRADEPPAPMQHYGRNDQGWQVTETPHFRIFHNQQRDLIEQVAQVAERTRVEMSRKWFGNDGIAWQPKCELVVHASAAEYSRLTGVPTMSPGHSRIERDPVTHRVVGRRMDLHVENAGMVSAVLPHETTHVVLAGQFGHHQVPRWADEGMAVLSEPGEKVEQHRRNLIKAARENQLFGVKELLELDNYPSAPRIPAFYAQSVTLVEFLVGQRGPILFSEFVHDGLRTNWDSALRKHYNWGLAELQQRWDLHVQGDAPRLASGTN